MLSKIWLPIGLSIAVVVGVVGAIGVASYWSHTSGTGTLAVAVHDAPCSDCSHVWVQFSSVSVHQSGVNDSGWTTLNVSGSTVDLIALNGTALAKVIGVASLGVGHYEQVRIAVTSVVVGLSTGTNVTAAVPSVSSADAHGEFNISSGATTTISIAV